MRWPSPFAVTRSCGTWPRIRKSSARLSSRPSKPLKRQRAQTQQRCTCRHSACRKCPSLALRAFRATESAFLACSVGCILTSVCHQVEGWLSMHGMVLTYVFAPRSSASLLQRPQRSAIGLRRRRGRRHAAASARLRHQQRLPPLRPRAHWLCRHMHQPSYCTHPSARLGRVLFGASRLFHRPIESQTPVEMVHSHVSAPMAVMLRAERSGVNECSWCPADSGRAQLRVLEGGREEEGGGQVRRCGRRRGREADQGGMSASYRAELAAAAACAAKTRPPWQPNAL